MSFRKFSFLAVVGAAVCSTSFSIAAAADATGPAKFSTFFPTDDASVCSKNSVRVTYLDNPVDVVGVTYDAASKRCTVTGTASSVDLASPRSGFALTTAQTPRPHAVFEVQPENVTARPGEPTPKPFGYNPSLPGTAGFPSTPFGSNNSEYAHNGGTMNGEPTRNGGPQNLPTTKSNGTTPTRQNELRPFSVYYAATTTAECSTNGLDVVYDGSPATNVRARLGPQGKYCEVSGMAKPGVELAAADAFVVKMNGVPKTVLLKP